MRYLLLLPLLAACKDPPPKCAPHGEEYTVCSDDEIYGCPLGDDATVAANLAIDDACEQTDDPIQCVVDADYTMIEMVLVEDCAGGDQVCVEDHYASPIVATCDDP
jgi:hypothetical protein